MAKTPEKSQINYFRGGAKNRVRPANRSPDGMGPEPRPPRAFRSFPGCSPRSVPGTTPKQTPKTKHQKKTGTAGKITNHILKVHAHAHAHTREPMASLHVFVSHGEASH